MLLLFVLLHSRNHLKCFNNLAELLACSIVDFDPLAKKVIKLTKFGTCEFFGRQLERVVCLDLGDFLTPFGFQLRHFLCLVADVQDIVTALVEAVETGP